MKLLGSGWGLVHPFEVIVILNRGINHVRLKRWVKCLHKGLHSIPGAVMPVYNHNIPTVRWENVGTLRINRGKQETCLKQDRRWGRISKVVLYPPHKCVGTHHTHT